MKNGVEITDRTKIRINLVLLVVTLFSLLSATVAASSFLTTIDNRLDAVEKVTDSVDELKIQVAEIGKDIEWIVNKMEEDDETKE